MAERWYIDSLDGRSGLSFASYRTSDLIDGPTQWPDLSAMAWFIAAPDFQPEPVSSRAIGFAAAQRGFQLGLSLDGETEVPFPSLEALTDYVRRLFISGGGGDGAAGVDPDLGEPPAGGEPEGGIDPESKLSLDLHGRPLMDLVAELLQKSNQLGDTETAAGLHHLGRQDSALDLPVPWALAVPVIAGEIGRRFARTSQTDRSARLSLGRSERALMILANALDARDLLVERRMILQWASFETIHQTNILDLLAILPIPRGLGQHAPPSESWQSVKDLFYGILGCPGLLAQPTFQSQRLAVFLFAAAALVSRGQRLRPIAANPEALQSMRLAFISQVFDWLRPQLPQFAFSHALEQTIIAASRPARV